MNKKSKYNLSDGEEDELETGSFPEKDDFEDEVPFDDEDDEEATENGSMSAFQTIFFSYDIQFLRCSLQLRVYNAK